MCTSLANQLRHYGKVANANMFDIKVMMVVVVIHWER
jgi:hypothetical protein